jgi:hypothetical protein
MEDENVSISDTKGIPAYPKIYNHYTPEGKQVLASGGKFMVQEKIDGSQFSFGLVDGEVVCRSKGVVLDRNGGQFSKAVEHVHSIKQNLVPGRIYRGEYLRSKKHNVITYACEPHGNIVLFDVQLPVTDYDTGVTTYKWVRDDYSIEGIAWALDVDFAPYIIVDAKDAWKTEWDASTYFKELAQNWMPRLGGKVEGFVIKPVEPVTDKYGRTLFCKYVTDEFREVHSDGKAKSPHKEYPTIAELAHNIGADMCTEARFAKTVQAMRDLGVEFPNNKNIGRAVNHFVEDAWLEGRSTFMAAVEAEIDTYRKQLTTAASKGFVQYLQSLPKDEVQ